ncbi:MAG: 30S ribosomal protein S14 [Paracoccaceae bacterium]|jgi:small subunit ribosomal protein S14|nr:30S ribosomal protein S14 [Paracoccaceae bacterium]
MAKTSSINRNNKRRKMAKSMGSKRAKLKALVMKKDTPMEERFAAALKLAEMPRNSAKVRIRNRCELTGRPRSFYRKVKLSRIALRQMANSGLIPGMVKSSW